MHSLKRFKPSLYQGAGMHDKYVVEPGAHAGSVLESMSIGGMRTMLSAMQPAGLRVAMRYARDAVADIAEVDHTAAAAVRAYVAEVGMSKLPRRASWHAMRAWSVAHALAPQ